MRVFNASSSRPEISKYQGNVVYLLGSTDVANCKDWQSDFALGFNEFDVDFINPRRSDIKGSWQTDLSSTILPHQINWELDHIDIPNMSYVVYLDPSSKEPFTLIQLGMLMMKKDASVHICCPKGFWRYDDVKLICDRYDVKCVETLDELDQLVRNMFLCWGIDKY